MDFDGTVQVTLSGHLQLAKFSDAREVLDSWEMQFGGDPLLPSLSFSLSSYPHSSFNANEHHRIVLRIEPENLQGVAKVYSY